MILLSEEIEMNPNQALWEKGDFTQLAAFMRDSGEEIACGLGIKRGMKVLDVGCGDGTTALPEAKLGAETAAGLLDASNAASRIQADDAGADVERGDIAHPAVAADRDLRRAAADVDVHHSSLIADRARCRARAIGRHHRLQAVTRAYRDELPGLTCEQFTDGARISPPHRDAGQDQRAGVDLIGIDIGALVLSLDEGAERLRVDLFLGGIGREQDVGLVESLAQLSVTERKLVPLASNCA
jgi:SAM-dependent methyltransferase